MDRSEVRALDDDALDALADMVAKELSRRKNRKRKDAVKQARELLALAGYALPDQLITLEEAAASARVRAEKTGDDHEQSPAPHLP